MGTGGVVAGLLWGWRPFFLGAAFAGCAIPFAACATDTTMSWRSILCSLGITLSVLGFLPIPAISAAQARPTTIVTPRDASWAEQLAAHEVRRYIYLRTGRRLPIMSDTGTLQPKENFILVGRKDRPRIYTLVLGPLSLLKPQSYWLSTCDHELPGGSGTKLLLVTGGDDAGVLYAAYALAEVLGVRFYLHGDVVPDERMEWKVPVLDLRGTPLFALRGIQPFHDFPEGPDWWNRDDYLAT